MHHVPMTIVAEDAPESIERDPFPLRVVGEIVPDLVDQVIETAISLDFLTHLEKIPEVNSPVRDLHNAVRRQFEQAIAAHGIVAPIVSIEADFCPLVERHILLESSGTDPARKAVEHVPVDVSRR